MRSQIRETRKLTDKPIGVDLILPAKVAVGAGNTRSEVRTQLKTNFPQQVAFVEKLMEQHCLEKTELDTEFVLANTSGDRGETPGSNQKNMIQQQVDVILEEDVQMFAAGLGDPSWVVPMACEKGMTVMGLVGSPRHAIRQVEAGVDIVVAQGYEAGGHTGKIANFPLIPQVVDAVAPRPVVAAGGIADGRGVAAALSLGAVGAWVGTAFLVSEECAIHDTHKRQIVDGESRDFEISRTYTGKTARMFRNEIVKAWTDADLDPLPMPYQKILMDDFNAAARAAGRLEVHSNPAGQAAGLLDEVRPAADIMRDLISGTVEALESIRDRVTTS